MMITQRSLRNISEKQIMVYFLDKHAAETLDWVCRVKIWSTLKGSGSPQKTLKLSENQNKSRKTLICVPYKIPKYSGILFLKISGPGFESNPGMLGSCRGLTVTQTRALWKLQWSCLLQPFWGQAIKVGLTKLHCWSKVKIGLVL